MTISTQQLISPGVFTNENDQSFLIQGIANIGGAIVGPFPKGPAFAPTLIQSQADLQNTFGIPDGQYYGPYTAQQYLQNQGTVTIVRVGHLGGYIQRNPVIIKATRGQYDRSYEVGGFTSYCFSGSAVTGSSGDFSDGGIVGTIAIQFTDTSSVYYGQNFELGNISGAFQSGSVSQTYTSSSISSSIQISSSTIYTPSSSYSHSFSYSSSYNTSQSIQYGTGSGTPYISQSLEYYYTPENSQSIAFYYGLTYTGSGMMIQQLTASYNFYATNSVYVIASGAYYYSGSQTFNGATQSFASFSIANNLVSTSIANSSSYNVSNSLNSYIVTPTFPSYSIATNFVTVTTSQSISSSVSGYSSSISYSSSILYNNVLESPVFISASFILPVSGNFPQFDDSILTSGVYKTTFNTLRFTGSIAGNYGPFEPNTFDSSSYSRSEDLVLAVLANTANDSGQNLWGFDGSTLAPMTTSSLTLNYSLNLKEVEFSTTENEGNPNDSSSYGIYNFSLDNGQITYITNVFGTDPLAGQSAIVSGSKPAAAYVYTSFDSTIAQVAGELLTSGWWKIDIEEHDGLVLNPAVVNCDPNNIAIPNEYVDSFAMNFTDGNPGGESQFDIRNAVTPWVISQNTSPDQNEDIRYQLFQLATLSDGTDMNTSYKIEITNIKLAGTVPGSVYGSFTVAVRQWGDQDDAPVYLEIFQNCTLDPNSAQYIAAVIGDQYVDINSSGKTIVYGNYANQSAYIRIIMPSGPYPQTVVPYGFEAYATPIGGLYSVNVPVMQYTSASTYPLNVGEYASGIDFQGPPTNADAVLTALYPANNAYQDNLQYFAPIPEEATIGQNVPFSLDKTCGISPLYNAGLERTVYSSRRFVFGFQYGFDGGSPSVPVYLGDQIIPTNQQGLDCSVITASGSVGYTQAVGALGNADVYDINLIVTPGINYEDHSYVAEFTVDMCENRGDCFYIMDLAHDLSPGGNSIGNIVGLAAQFDTNYAGSYYPWVKIKDTNTNKIINVPPSVVIPAVYSLNDSVSAEWFAPAGLNRGGIPTAVDIVDRLTHTDRDQLYEGKVNPIAIFPGQGITVWGQKTLQNKVSALNRINVRRLLIALKKYIASISRYLVFEQNVTSTQQKFLNIVNPYLTSVQQRSGLYDFRVIMDNTNNTPAIIDQNILYGQLYIKPTKTAEFVVLDFNILTTGATFPSNT